MSTDKWNKLYVYNHGDTNRLLENSNSDYHNKNVTDLKKKHDIYTNIMMQNNKDSSKQINLKKGDVKNRESVIHRDIKLNVKNLDTKQFSGLKKIDSNMIKNTNKRNISKMKLYPTLNCNDYEMKNSQTFNINNNIDLVYTHSKSKNKLISHKILDNHTSTPEKMCNNLNFGNSSCALKNNNVKNLLVDSLLFLDGVKNENKSNVNFSNQIKNNYSKNPILSKKIKAFIDNNTPKLHRYVENICNRNTDVFLNKKESYLLNNHFKKNNPTICCADFTSEEMKKSGNFNEKYINSIKKQESIIHDDFSKFKRRDVDVECLEKNSINISKLIHSYGEYQKKKQEEVKNEKLFKLRNKEKGKNNSSNENVFDKENKNIDTNNIREHYKFHKDSMDKVKFDDGLPPKEEETKSSGIRRNSSIVLDYYKKEKNLFDNSIYNAINKYNTFDSNKSSCFNENFDSKKNKEKKDIIRDGKNNFNENKKVKNPDDILNSVVLNDSYLYKIKNADNFGNKRNKNKINNHNDNVDNMIYKNKNSVDSMNSYLCKKVLGILRNNEKRVFSEQDKDVKDIDSFIDPSENSSEEKEEVINLDNNEKKNKFELNRNNNEYISDIFTSTDTFNITSSDNTCINKSIIINNRNNNNNSCSNSIIRYNSNFTNSNISTIENFSLCNFTSEAFTKLSSNDILNLMNFKNLERNNSSNMKKLKDNTTSKNNINNFKEEIKNKKMLFENTSINNNSKLNKINNSINISTINNEINFISNEDLNSFDIVHDKNVISENYCFNDIIVKDIEEKKMNKLFFEEICVFRLNEKNDIYDYKSQPVNLFYDRSLRDIDLTKLEINKKYCKDINEEVKNLIKKEDIYEIEMNIGLVFRKFIPVTMNLSCNYLLIKKNEKNIITCISYSNITGINIVKKNERRKVFLFKLVYVFKKKKQSEKNVTLLFKTNDIEVYEKIKSKIEPILMKESKNKEYLDIETVYGYIIDKYKRMHILYLKHLLQNVEKILRKFVFKCFFQKLKLKHAYLKKIEDIKKQKSKLIQSTMDKLEFAIRKKLQNYFNVLLIKSYEKSFVNYQVKTNNILFNMLIKEKSSYQENMDKQSTYLLFNVLYSLYKKKMTNYFNCFINNNRVLSKGKNAFSYTITHLNSILIEYDKRIKNFVLSKLKFNYDSVSYFSFIMYKLYLKRLILGYLRIRDNRLNAKFLIEKNVYNLVKVISRLIENKKCHAFLKLQKHIFEEKEKKNKIICDHLIYANNELCNNLDKIAMEKGINKMECVYKFKIKESLVKYFYKLKGPQINSEHFNLCLKYCGIFIFILNKIIQRKIQNIFYFFVLKCFQDNNKSRLIYSMKTLELLLIKKDKRYIIDLLKFYDNYPYLFKYRHLSKIEIFIISIENFIYSYNKKLLLNFMLKLHYLKYQGKIIKAYMCIGNLYKFIDLICRKIQSQTYEPFRLLLQNAREKNHKIIREKLKIKKTQLKINNSKIPSILNLNNDDISSNRLNLIKKYPLFFYNSDISPDCTTIADDKLSLRSNDSVSNIFSYAYEDMDKIKRKIYDFNTRISHTNI